MLKPVTVGRYDPPGEDYLVELAEPGVPPPYIGYVETRDWILYEQTDGTLTIYNQRTASGEVMGQPTVIRPEA